MNEITQPESVLTLAKEQKEFRKSNFGKGIAKKPGMISELVFEGEKYLEKFNFFPVFGSTTCDFYTPKRHKAVEEVVGKSNTPARFQPCQKISSLEEYSRLEHIIYSMEPDLREFWRPSVWLEDNPKSDFAVFLKRLARTKDRFDNQPPITNSDRVEAMKNFTDMLPDGNMMFRYCYSLSFLFVEDLKERDTLVELETSRWRGIKKRQLESN